MLYIWVVVDVNVEFAHIYVNETASSEHFQAANIFRENALVWREENIAFKSCVLIDDYNPSEFLLDIDGFFNELDLIGSKPDHVFFESNLVSIEKILINDMSGKIKREYQAYISKSGKCPCSFLVAAWSLLRLGIYSSDKIKSIDGDKPFIEGSGFCGRSIVTILPMRYAGVEKKALDIIRSTPYYESVKDNISHIFF